MEASSKFGGSWGELDKAVEEEKPRLLRRAFSSKRRKKPKPAPHHPAAGDSLLVPSFPLRIAKSNPSCDENQPDDGPLSFHSDLASRRSVFSRKNYGSVEMLANQLDSEGYTNNAGRFRAEVGSSEKEQEGSVGGLNSPVHLENPESQTRWYFKFFLGKVHQVYTGFDHEKEPFVLAVVVTDANNNSVPQYRAILWRKMGSQKLCIPYNPAAPLTVKKILSQFNVTRLEKSPREVFNSEVQKDILILEEQEGSVNFKFGILLCQEGQSSDEDMYNNENGTEDFKRFVSLLGDSIRLKNWDHFKGGLDTKTDTTGLESVYTVYEGHEIMFHVSTLLPYSIDNRQQVERKRHIGNDIVNIIFIDGSDPDRHSTWRPSMMKTHFTHLFAIVTFNKETNAYKLNIYAEESVPLFGPPLPNPPEFKDHQSFREFLLVKLINGEKAAFDTPVFAQKRQRTLDMLLRNIIETYATDNTKIGMLNRRAFSDIIPDQQNGISTRKEEARNVEFMRIGQSLKLKTILRGDAPTSLITTGLLKREPWQPHSFHCDFHLEVICGDTWGDKLVVSTDCGTFLLEEHVPPKLLIDKTVSIRQLAIIESQSVCIMRTGKDAKICVFQLSDFEGDFNELPLNRTTIKEQKIERTKGCHLFAISRSVMTPLRLVVANARRLQIFMWKCVTTWSSLSSWNQFTPSQVASGFQFLRELPTFESAQLITLVESNRGQNQICIGYRNQFDLIDEKTGDTQHLYRADSSKAQVIAAIDVCADDEAELLLCHHRTCHFQKLFRDRRTVELQNSLSGASSPTAATEFDFSWNFEPRNIIIAFPYVLAFTEHAVEIRLIINGNLVHTMSVPHCRLITSKVDIYFATTAANFGNDIVEKCGHSPQNRSPNLLSVQPPVHDAEEATGGFNIYKIPLTSLSGSHSSALGSHSPVHRGSFVGSVLADKPPGRGEGASGTKALHLRPDQEKERHSSIGNDSGIQVRGDSPPSSPPASSTDTEDVLEGPPS